MLVEELDVAIVDAFRNLLADLVRSTSLNHVEFSPSIFCFSTRGGANKKVVLELALEAVLLDMISHGCGYLSVSSQTIGSSGLTSKTYFG